VKISTQLNIEKDLQIPLHVGTIHQHYHCHPPSQNLDLIDKDDYYQRPHRQIDRPVHRLIHKLINSLFQSLQTCFQLLIMCYLIASIHVVNMRISFSSSTCFFMCHQGRRERERGEGGAGRGHVPPHNFLKKKKDS
jgi:hypothetical protein